MDGLGGLWWLVVGLLQGWMGGRCKALVWMWKWVQAVYKDDDWLLFMGFTQGLPALAAFVWSKYPSVLAKL
jgi:hypothetical protein